MDKIEKIKELKSLLDIGALNQEQYLKLLNEIIEKPDNETSTKTDVDTSTIIETIEYIEVELLASDFGIFTDLVDFKINWNKKVGEYVDTEAPLFEIHQDKCFYEFFSPFNGVLIDIIAKEGHLNTIDEIGLIVKIEVVKTEYDSIINKYDSVKIGKQEWMTENLNVKTFRNGDQIREASNHDQWLDCHLNQIPAWCYYNDDPINGEKYGLLYNVWAVRDERGLAPIGWEIPSQNDFKELIGFLGGDELAGRALKSRDNWYRVFIGPGSYSRELGKSGTNKSGFNAKPAGYIIVDDWIGRAQAHSSFQGVEEISYMWTRDFIYNNHDNGEESIWNKLNFEFTINANSYTYFDLNTTDFLSVRCIRKEAKKEKIYKNPSIVKKQIALNKTELIKETIEKSEEDNIVEENLALREVADFGLYDPTLELCSYKYPINELLDNYFKGETSLNSISETHIGMIPILAIVNTTLFKESDMELPIVIGNTETNDHFILDLEKISNLIIEGDSSNDRKNMIVNTIIVSLLYVKHPALIKLALIDSKNGQLVIFKDLKRHFLAKSAENNDSIVSENDQIINSLNSLYEEMNNRYSLIKMALVNNVNKYNEKFKNKELNPETEGHKFLPYIIVVINEIDELILKNDQNVIYKINKLLKLSKTVGFHFIVTTTNPLNDLANENSIIKSNKDDYNNLDFYYSVNNQNTKITRVFIDTMEIKRIVEFIGSQKGYFEAYILNDKSNPYNR